MFTMSKYNQTFFPKNRKRRKSHYYFSIYEIQPFKNKH